MRWREYTALSSPKYIGICREMLPGSLQQFYSSFTVDAVNPGEHQRRQLGVDKRISNPSKHRKTLRSGFLNRESEVRILPGALCSYPANRRDLPDGLLVSSPPLRRQRRA